MKQEDPGPESGAPLPSPESGSDSEAMTQGAGKDSSHPSENDDELRRATDLALAIQNNPSMTMEDIHQLQQNKQQDESQNNNEDVVGSLGSSHLNKKGRAFRFDGSRLTAIRAAVTGHQQNRDSPLQGDQYMEDTTEQHNREKSRRLLDGHRIKAAFHRDQGKDVSSSRGGAGGVGINAEMDGSNNSRTNNSSGHAGMGHSRRLMRSNKARTPPPSPRGGDTTGRTTVAAVPGVLDSSNMGSTTGRSTSANLLQNIQAAITHGKQIPISKAPIRVTCIAWKRRGGMGKFATSGGWERRRIELQGSRILYYAKDETDDAPDDEEVGEAGLSESTVALGSDENVTSTSLKRDTGGEDVGEGVVVAKQANWFENAFSNHQDDCNTPRGFLDLAKEKASVHAALGHGGAPSPFAISIKVRGETKWKFCFDHHRTQMEWLAALTDVVVQNSVDMYNANTLEGADPTNNDGLTMLTNAITAPIKPLPTQENGGGTRLWQIQSYSISSQTPRDDDDEYEDNDDLELDHDDEDILAILPTEADHKKAQIVACEESGQKWVIPEENFLLLAVILNTAIAIARSSLLSLDGFWILVVVSNASLYSCLAKEPDWRSLVSFVRASHSDESKKGFGSRSKDKILGRSESTPTNKSKNEVGFKPVAGTTTVKLKNPTDLPVNKKNEVFAGWRCPPGEGLLVRSHGYLTTKKKIPSPGELYECIQCDIFEAPTRYPDVATRVKLPTVTFDDGTNKGPKTWRAPDMFVITVALPTDPPKFGRSSSDGGGYTITMYMAMKQETRDILWRVTAEGYDPSKEDYGSDIQKNKVNAVRLLEEWVRRAPADQTWFSRFKCIPNAHNLREIGMPSYISKYNGKPFLIKRPGVTGFIHQHPELSVFEFDISLHPFPYLARQGICFLKESFFKKVLVSFGFVIEGRSDDELPECIIGCLQLCYPDPAHGIQAWDFFSGTAPKSFEV